MEAMAGDSHVAGQPSSKRVADYALAKFKSFGLDAELRRVRGDDAVAARDHRRTGRAGEVHAADQGTGAAGRSRLRRSDAALQRLFRRRRRHRRSGLRQLRHARGLRAPEGAGHQRQGQDRARALRRRLARHQAEGGARERRDRLPDLFRSARRRLLPGRCVSGRSVSPRVRRAARQRDGHADSSGRSADARMGQRSRRPQEQA